MSTIRTFRRKDGTMGLFRGKGQNAVCLFYGSYETIVPLGQALKQARKARKASSNA